MQNTGLQVELQTYRNHDLLITLMQLLTFYAEEGAANLDIQLNAAPICLQTPLTRFVNSWTKQGNLNV